MRLKMNKTTILKQHIGYWINRMRNIIHYAFEERLAQYDISVAEWSILISIYDGSASSVNEIAAYIEVDKASISRTVERLSCRGVVVHQAGKDKRSRVIKLTEKGMNLVPQLLKEAEENEKYFFNNLSEVDKKQMQVIMHTILYNIPNIKLDGWININNHEVNMNKTKEILKEATINQWPYPKTFEALKAAGLEHYTVHFADYYKAEFKGKFDNFTEEHLDGYNSIKVSDNFSADGIKNALIKHVAQRTRYLDFLQDAAENGVTHYKVDIAKRTVTYFNLNESAHYVECVPQYE